MSLGGAAIGVVVIFAVAVVVTARPDLFSVASGASQCQATQRVADAVEPMTTGYMAAFQTLDPVDVTALPYDGEATLADVTGRLTLLNLWATWCAPCRVEMPELAALQSELGGDDFSVVAVSIDDKDRNRPEDFLEESGASNLAYHREPTLSLFNSLRAEGLAQGMPTTLLLGPDGCTAGVLHGAAAWNSEDAKALIRAAIEAN
ncbi:TlpA family protein disulfide reductase [Acuticoccus sp. M5D2P5]|uniref:TlpA family protein disulfide reductase n=1 Tax=Acuticoccus kalidii TaxID=2910977 RepID=UPI001F41242C|nr:TlpA disulfide reductase family protein [Acuticoccus kalidii]MCF3932775.1 TlpA family protein disulfide reductase [Acuticoccus kalidii]